MPRDVFVEQTLARRNDMAYRILYWTLWAAVAVLGFYSALSLFNIIAYTQDGEIRINLIAAIITVAAGALAIFVYRKTDDVRIEYDYAFTNGILDVSRVMNRRRRRYMMELDLKTVERAGYAGDGEFERLRRSGTYRLLDFTLNRGAEKMYFAFAKNGKNYIALIEPSQEMESAIRSRAWLPQGVLRDKGTI